jgi:hypothetical protein
MKPTLIAISGLKGAGKSTIARILQDDYKFHRIGFADPLKRMLAAIGLSHAELYGELKETPHELLVGRTPRHAMQTLGTEWGRNCIGQDFWTAIWRGIVREELRHNYRVVCDDLRFLNEAVVVKALGGSIWRVHRPKMELNGDSHQSELEQSRLPFDLRFSNDGSQGDLRALVHKVMEKL